MKFMKKLVSFIIFSFFAIGLSFKNVVAANITSGSYTYRDTSSGTIEIVKYNGSEENVVVPSTIDGKKVEKILVNAFQELSTLKTVTISEGIDDIDMYTFSKCENLTKVIFPKSTKYISRYFYKSCPKITYDIPSHLTKMEEGSYIDVATVTIRGTRNYDLANEVLPIVNEERAKLGLAPLKISAELMEVAMKRAAEISIYWSHMRPNGMDCFTIDSNFDKENIAANQSTAASVMQSWMNSPGHRAAIIGENFKSIGIGCYKINGVIFWVQLFSTDESTNEQKITGSQEHEDKIYIKKYSDVIAFYIQGLGESITLTLGETVSPRDVVFINDVSDKMTFHTSIALSDISWSSSNPEVFQVDKNGKITAVGTGTATLQAMLGDKTYESVVMVVDPIPDDYKIQLNYKNYQLNNENETIVLRDELISNDLITWKSSDESIAITDENGKVKAINGGVVRITAITENYGQASCLIYVSLARTLSDGSKAYPGDLNRDGVINSIDIAVLGDWYTKTLTQDEIAVADMNCDGVVNSNDAATLSDFYNGGIQFKPGNYVHITSMTLNETNITLEKGSSISLSATTYPKETMDSSIIQWRTSNENIVKIDQNGNAVAMGGGTATITAIADNGRGVRATATIVVPGLPLEVATSVEVTSENEILGQGLTNQMTAVVNPPSLKDKSVNWSVSDESIATITQKGVLTAKKSGTVIVYATSTSGLAGTKKITIKEKKNILYIQNGKTYYYDSNGKKVTGWQTINNEKYYFNSDGEMQKGITTIQGKKYFLGVTKGKLMRGWIEWNGNKYYADPTTGVLAQGVTTIDGKTYFFGISKNKLMTYQFEYNGKTYYPDSNGVLR